MELSEVSIQELINNPRESLTVEVKEWIDPNSVRGKAKIVKACLALRNHGGGYLVIGFEDGTLQPSNVNAPIDVRTAFHSDTIQALIARYASESFEVTVEFFSREGREFPVLAVPTGVRTPVASKADLFDGKTKLICTDDVYIRTLNANNTPSSAKATWKDWGRIVDVSFDNREADIGRFVRRHLSGVRTEHLKKLFELASGEFKPPETINQRLDDLINQGRKRFDDLVLDKTLSLPQTGYWEVGLIIDGLVPHFSANRDFLNLIDANNSDLTNSPIWMNTSNFRDEASHPFVYEERWESLVVALQGLFHHIDFNQMDPKGRFYYLSALEDDISAADRRPEALTAFDQSLPVFRCAEAVALGLAFAKAMHCSPTDCTLQFAFRWTGLKGRVTSTWAYPKFRTFGRGPAQQDKITRYLAVPLETPNSAIGGLLTPALSSLYELFDGMKLNLSAVEALVEDMFNRRW